MNTKQQQYIKFVFVFVRTGRPGQYKVSRYNKKLTNNADHLQSTNLTTDDSVVHSRSMCRSDLIASASRHVGATDGGSSAETSNFECTQPSSMPRQTILSDHHNVLKSAAGHRSNHVSEYDIGRKLEDFMVNSTPRQLIKHKSSSKTPIRWWCLTFILFEVFERVKSSSVMHGFDCPKPRPIFHNLTVPPPRLNMFSNNYSNPPWLWTIFTPTKQWTCVPMLYCI